MCNANIHGCSRSGSREAQALRVMECMRMDGCMRAQVCIPMLKYSNMLECIGVYVSMYVYIRKCKHEISTYTPQL